MLQEKIIAPLALTSAQNDAMTKAYKDFFTGIESLKKAQLEILLPLSILFLVNRFVLVSRFLFKGKIIVYIFSLLGVIFFLTMGSYIYDLNKDKFVPQKPIRAENEMKPPRGHPPDRNDRRKEPQRQRQPRPVPPFANFLIFSFLIVGFDTGLRSGIRWIEVENAFKHGISYKNESFISIDMILGKERLLQRFSLYQIGI